jgi:hypothetical protein
MSVSRHRNRRLPQNDGWHKIVVLRRQVLQRPIASANHGLSPSCLMTGHSRHHNFGSTDVVLP